MERVNKAVGRLEEGFAAIGLLAATLLMFANVVLRYVFSAGLPWSEELIRYAIIWITFLGMGLCARKGAHVAIDFFAYYMSKRQQRWLTIIVDAICILFCLAMLKYSGELVLKQYSTGQKAPALQVPFYVIYLCMPLGFALGALRFAQDLLSRIGER